MKEFVCIVCPRGCNLKVDDEGNVSGYTCLRGKNYAIQEMKDPRRSITSSIRVSNRIDTLVSVKTSGDIPKNRIFDVMKEINEMSVEAPTHIGQVVKKDVLQLGVDIIVTKEIDQSLLSKTRIKI